MKSLMIALALAFAVGGCSTGPASGTVVSSEPVVPDPCNVPASLVSAFPGLEAPDKTPLDTTDLPGVTGCYYAAPDKKSVLALQHFPLVEPPTGQAKEAYRILRQGLDPKERQYVTVVDLPKSGAKGTVTSSQVVNGLMGQAICQTANDFVSVNYGTRESSVTPPQFVDSLDTLARASGCRPAGNA